MSSTNKENINDTFFDGQYKEIWRDFIPEELTKKEVDFMVDYFNLKPGDKVLDLMCGYGRHAIALARRGIQVTAVDNLSEYIDEIWNVVSEENLLLEPIKSEVLQFNSEEKFDLIICMGNSINFFPENSCIILMKKVRDFLKSSGNFLINTWSLAEIVIKHFLEKSWEAYDDLLVISESKFLFFPTRVEIDFTMIRETETLEIKKGIDYIFSLSEFDKMLAVAGLSLTDVFSIPGKKRFILGEPRAYLISQRIAQ